MIARWTWPVRGSGARSCPRTFAAGRIVATGVLAARDQADPVRAMRYEGGVHPAYRGRGLGTALLDWAAGAAGVIHAGRFPGRPLSLQCGFPESDDRAAVLFAEHGFTPVRYFRRMTRRLERDNLPPARMPDGFEIVGYRADLDEPMRVAKNEAFAEHWDSTPTPPEMWRSRFTGPEFQPELSPLAVDAATGEIVGLVITHLNQAQTAAMGQRDAHLNNVATLRRARGLGIATALLVTMLQGARERGFGTASLDVDAENATGALGVYGKVGFTVADTWVTYGRDIAA
jgi:mycothiol synthase